MVTGPKLAVTEPGSRQEKPPEKHTVGPATAPRSTCEGSSATAIATAFAVLLSMLASALPAPAAAGTLGRITAIERNPDTVTIDGEPLRVTAESRIYQSDPEAEQPAVITFRSLSVGDFVVVERDGSVIKTLQRFDPQSIDMGAAPVLRRPPEGS